VHSAARQDAERHLQRLVRRGGVEVAAAAAGAAVAAAHPATVDSPCSSSGPVNSTYFVVYIHRRIGLVATSQRAYFVVHIDRLVAA
jgi:hypothetical protein